MKLVSFHAEGRDRFGLVRDGGIVDLTDRLGAADMRALLEGGPDLLARARDVGMATPPAFDLAGIAYRRPVPFPEKIICVGVNYAERNEEYRDGSEKPRYPSLFMRTPGSFVGHRAPILQPLESRELDYEGEIVIVIGRPGRRIAREAAASHIAGLTCMNEGTVRDWIRHGKFNVTQGKNFEASGAIGPWIVTCDELPSFDALRVTTRVNGEVRQDDTTARLSFPFDAILAYVSTFTALKPGDLIATGTPVGTGARRDPPVFLRPGDVVEVEVSGIGTLVNEVEAEQA